MIDTFQNLPLNYFLLILICIITSLYRTLALCFGLYSGKGSLRAIREIPKLIHPPQRFSESHIIAFDGSINWI